MEQTTRWKGLVSNVVRFATDRRGGTAVEYAIIAAGISIAIAATVVSTGSALMQHYQKIGDAMPN